MNQASRTKPTVRHEFYPHSNQIYDKKTKMKGLQEIVTQATRKQSKKTTFNYNQCRCYLNRKNQSEGMTRKVQMVLLRLQRDANGQWWWWLSRPLAASKQVFPSFTVSSLLPRIFLLDRRIERGLVPSEKSSKKLFPNSRRGVGGMNESSLDLGFFLPRFLAAAPPSFFFRSSAFPLQSSLPSS